MNENKLIMDCKELKIWVDRVNEDELLLGNANVQTHINECESCSLYYKGLLDSYSIMKTQRESSLSKQMSAQIINKLQEVNSTHRVDTRKTLFVLSRIAAVLVVSIGMLTGGLIGEVINKEKEDDSAAWQTEFSLLADDGESDLYLFD